MVTTRRGTDTLTPLRSRPASNSDKRHEKVNGLENDNSHRTSGGDLTLHRVGRAVWALVPLLVWVSSSSALIIINKQVMVDLGFTFPMTLTSFSQFTSALGAWTIARAGLGTLRGPPPRQVFIERLLPIVACSAGTLWLGNLAYLSLSVAFIQILKALTPAVTMLVCLAVGLEQPSLLLLISVTAMAAGTGVAAALERGLPTFAWGGFLAFMASLLLEALRVVLVEVLLGGQKFTALEGLVYLGPATGTVLGLGAAVTEWKGLLQPRGGLAIVASNPGMFMAVAVLSAAVNVSCFLAIQQSSSLTFKVVGCAKNVLVVWAGVLSGDKVQGGQLAGYSVSMGGFLLYSWVNLRLARGRMGRRKQS